MPQIAHAFSSRKIKQLPTVTGRETLPLDRYALRLAKIAPPKCFGSLYATEYTALLWQRDASDIPSKSEKLYLFCILPFVFSFRAKLYTLPKR